MTKTKENKVDRRRHYILVIDTETANTFTEKKTLKSGVEKNELITECALFYDFGYAVTDTHGNIYETGSYVNADIFFDMPELMQSAYYANKIPRYLTEIKEGKRKVSTTFGIKKIVTNILNKYNISEVCAHNARFDLTTVNGTLRYITKSKYRYFYPYGIEIWDSLKMARSILSQMPTYLKFCELNGYITPKTKKPKMTAEVIFRFISGDTDFEERHTGLEDVLIECAIVAYCYKQHKRMDKALFKKEAQTND